MGPQCTPNGGSGSSTPPIYAFHDLPGMAPAGLSASLRIPYPPPHSEGETDFLQFDWLL